MNNLVVKDRLIGGIGRTLLDVKASNPFPFIGEEVTLKAITRWAQELDFKKRHDVNAEAVTEVIANTSLITNSKLTVSSEGNLLQEVRAYNFTPDKSAELFSALKKRFLYPMQKQTLPYHNIEVSTEICRTDLYFTVSISSDNGYDLSRENTLDVYVLKENGSIDVLEDIVIHYTAADFTFVNGVFISKDMNVSLRGIYDILTKLYDVSNKLAISKREDKLVTITPRLAALPVDGQEPFGSLDSSTAGAKVLYYKTGNNDLYMFFDVPDTGYYGALNVSLIPSGYDAYTMVLAKPYKEDDNVITRIRLTSDMVNGDPWKSPTPLFAREHPLVITVNQDTPFYIHGESWNALNLEGIRNVVVDGRGYHNLEKGIRFTSNPITGNKPNIPIQFSGGSTDMELFEIEITDTGFTAIMAKTDPDATNPWWWYGNFDLKNFHLHHLYIHDTSGEGVYLGYFDTGAIDTIYEGETITFKNLKGEDVTYYKGTSYKKKAHYQTNFRMFRCLFEHTGYDGIQITSAVGEISHNTLIDCAFAEEAALCSGASILGISGKFYNNVLYNCHGNSLQINPIGDIELYNNVIYSTYGGGILFLFGYGIPEQNPTGAPEGSGVINEDLQMVFHNNVIATPGNIANGRNTVLVRGLHFYDNVLVHSGTLFSNMTGDTIATWKAQAINNTEFKYSDFYEKSSEYKFGDYEGGDFRIAFDSSLASSGLGKSFSRDHRGYLNWNPSGLSPIGPYLGIHADLKSVTDSLAISQVLLNRGDTGTDDINLRVEIRHSGVATQYRIGEAADLSDAAWKVLQEQPLSYTLNNTAYGNKTVYALLKNNLLISEIAKGIIELTPPVYTPLKLHGIKINNGEEFTEDRSVKISLDYTEKSTTAVGYRASEIPEELTDMPFIDVVNPFSFLLSSGFGNKIVYAQMIDNDNNITDVAFINIDYRKGPTQITTVSFDWGNDGKGYEDGINKINAFDKNWVIKSNIGNDFGKYTFLSNFNSALKVYQHNLRGAITGDNSGEYPDIYLERNACTTTNWLEAWTLFKFEGIKAGKYRMRIFASSVDNVHVTDAMFYTAYTGYETDTLVEYQFRIPDNIKGNTRQWMVIEIDVPADGTIHLKLGREWEALNFRINPINIIDFTEVVELTSFKLDIKRKGENEIQFHGICLPEDSTQTNFDWSIVEPTIHAEINTAGVLTIKPTATQEEVVTVKAVSPYNKDLMDTISVPIKYTEPVI